MIKLGHTTGGNTIPLSRKERIEILLENNNSAIEISFLNLSYLEDELDDEEIEMIKQFDYISIHATVVIKRDPETSDKQNYQTVSHINLNLLLLLLEHN